MFSTNAEFKLQKQKFYRFYYFIFGSIAFIRFYLLAEATPISFLDSSSR